MESKPRENIVVISIGQSELNRTQRTPFEIERVDELDVAASAQALPEISLRLPEGMHNQKRASTFLPLSQRRKPRTLMDFRDERARPHACDRLRECERPVMPSASLGQVLVLGIETCAATRRYESAQVG